MMSSNNSGNKAAFTVISPEFSLLRNYNMIFDITAASFSTASPKERELLFKARRILDSVVDEHKDIPIDDENYINILVSAKDHLNSADVPKRLKIVFPGIVGSLHISDESLIKLIEISDNLTFSLDDLKKDGLLERFIQVLKSAANNRLSLNIITDAYLSVNDTEPILELWKAGTDLTLCHNTNVQATLKAFGIHNAPDFDVYDEMIIVPGKTIIKTVPINLKQLEKHDNLNEYYLYLKAYLRKIIEKVQIDKYSRSPKGKLFRRMNIVNEKLSSLRILYEDYISESRISQVSRDEYDIIDFSVTLENSPYCDAPDELKCLSAACKYLEGLYKFKPRLSLKDIRYAYSIADLKNILKQHTDISRFACGGALLDLSVDKSFNLSDSNVKSFLNEFFGYGGTMIKIRYV